MTSKKVSYPLKVHQDSRGKFIELFKSYDCGQVSFFTIKPGITRGSHYHDTKTEKFFLAKGKVKITQKNLLNKDIFNIVISDKEACIVDSIPGYAHEIQNIGLDEAFIVVWANEIFDKNRPDTFIHEGFND